MLSVVDEPDGQTAGPTRRCSTIRSLDGTIVLITGEGTLEFFRSLLTALPDFHMDVEVLLASGDKTVARVRATATHQGEFMGVPPTGKRVDMELIDIMRFDDAGVVCEHWGVADMLALMQQLGLVPSGLPAEGNGPSGTG
jgi:predicted ester cyclase